MLGTDGRYIVYLTDEVEGNEWAWQEHHVASNWSSKEHV